MEDIASLSLLAVLAAFGWIIYQSRHEPAATAPETTPLGGLAE